MSKKQPKTVVLGFKELPGESKPALHVANPESRGYITLPMTDQHGRTWDVDVGIAPLIRALWDRGSDTSQSGQGDEDRFAFIVMPQADAARLLRTLFPRLHVEQLRGRYWLIEAEPFLRRGSVECELVMRFPKEDIGWVTRRLRESVKAKMATGRGSMHTATKPPAGTQLQTAKR